MKIRNHRAWCPDQKEMFLVTKLPLDKRDTIGEVIPFYSRNYSKKTEIDFGSSSFNKGYQALIVMTSLEIEDKNGTEVFVGDIVNLGKDQFEIVSVPGGFIAKAIELKKEVNKNSNYILIDEESGDMYIPLNEETVKIFEKEGVIFGNIYEGSNFAKKNSRINRRCY